MVAGTPAHTNVEPVQVRLVNVPAVFKHPRCNELLEETMSRRSTSIWCLLVNADTKMGTLSIRVTEGVV
eukprot:866229-Rhodomonas_salina.1